MSWTFSALLRRPDLRSIVGKAFSLCVGAFSVHTVMVWSSIALVLGHCGQHSSSFPLSRWTNLFSLLSLMFPRENNPGRTFRIRFNPPESEWEETHTMKSTLLMLGLYSTSWKPPPKKHTFVGKISTRWADVVVPRLAWKKDMKHLTVCMFDTLSAGGRLCWKRTIGTLLALCVPLRVTCGQHVSQQTVWLWSYINITSTQMDVHFEKGFTVIMV